MDNSRHFHSCFANHLVDEAIRKNQLERKLANGEVAHFGDKYQGQFDQDLYGGMDKGIVLEEGLME